MASASDDGAVESLASSRSAKETLSQFVARVLDQLSLSAWLPSAALVLLLVVLFQLGAALDDDPPPDGPLDALGQAFEGIGDMRLGAAILLVIAVVVLTMVTQAFSFEAIRVLEGYWGTNTAVEALAFRRCEHHRKVRARLDRQHEERMKAAWPAAEAEIQRKQQVAVELGSKVYFTRKMISALRSQTLGEMTKVELSPKQEKIVANTDWREHAVPEDVRRLVNLERRLSDFPIPERILPTALGNVLRHFEDKLERPSVETFVQEVFDTLPFSLRVEHDEQRTRLDLYCSMVVVFGAVTAVAAARLLDARGYLAGSVATGLVGMLVTYRAAVASARAYGGLLLLIRRHVDERSTAA
jgi:hypothetical protein